MGRAREHLRLAKRAAALAITSGLLMASLGSSAGSVAGIAGNPSQLIGSPVELLDTLKTTSFQTQGLSRASFFDVFVEISTAHDIGTSCDALLREMRLKGYRRNNQALPTTCAGLRNNSLARDAFQYAFVRDPQNNLQVELFGASLETDTHTSHGSRAYLDIWLDRQTPGASIVQLVLTNNWSDQPEVIKAAKGNLQVNGENRFFVDVARVIRYPQVNAAPTLKLTWYRYWWHDSHVHSWWFYGAYSWWWWQYSWTGGTWYWWWNAWWPWWHSYHWYWWSNWWADLNPVRTLGN